MKKVLYFNLALSALFSPLQAKKFEEVDNIRNNSLMVKNELRGATIWDYSNSLKEGRSVTVTGNDARDIINDMVGYYKEVRCVNSSAYYIQTERFIMSKSTGYISFVVNGSGGDIFPYIQVASYDYAIELQNGSILKGWNEDGTFNELNTTYLNLADVKSYEVVFYHNSSYEPRELDSLESGWVKLNEIYPISITGGKDATDPVVNKVFDYLFRIEYPPTELASVFDFLKTLFVGLSDIFAIKLFGFLPIGTIVAIPIIFAILKFILDM